MDRILSRQLVTLQTDHIDYYLLHSMSKESREKMAKLGVLAFLDRAKSEGKIKNAGFSFHGTITAFKEIVDAYDWQFCQIQDNFLDENNQAGTEGLRYAAGKNLAVMIMEPLRGGNLAGPVPEIQKIWDEAPEKRSAAEWGLCWVWDHPEVTVVLSGMNDEAHIDENIRVAGSALPQSLTPDDLARSAGPETTYRRLMKVGCTGLRVLHALPGRCRYPRLLLALQRPPPLPERPERKVPLFRAARGPHRRCFVCRALPAVREVREGLSPAPADPAAHEGCESRYGGRDACRRAGAQRRPVVHEQGIKNPRLLFKGRSPMTDAASPQNALVRPIPLGHANAFLIRGSLPILVDTGLPGNAPKILCRPAGRGVQALDLALIIITHVHTDHFGSAAALAGATGAPVLVHSSEADALTRVRLFRRCPRRSLAACSPS